MGDEDVSLFLRTWAMVTSVKNFRWLWDVDRIPIKASMVDEDVSLFLRTLTFSSEKLKAVVTSVEKFRWLWEFDSVPEGGFHGLLEGMDMYLWYIYGNISVIPTILGLMLLFVDPRHNNMWLLVPEGIVYTFWALVTHPNMMHSIIYWYRDMPFRFIGAKDKFKLEFIPMIIAAAFHHLFEFNFVEFNYGYFCVMLGITTYIYTITHFMHIAYDIGGKDVLLGLVMLVLAYFLKGGLLVRGLVLSLCVALCFYRYVTYSAPELPEHDRSELVQSPC